MLLLAIPALALGMGVGIRWLSAGAIVWMSIGAGLLLIGGLIMLVAGLSRLSSGLPPLRRIVIVIVVLFGASTLVWTLAPAVVAVSVPPLEGPLPSVFGLEGEEVTFTSDDGAVLWGWFVAPDHGSVVVLRHGSGSTSASLVEHAAVLVNHGHGVLLSDARGHGRSNGEGMDFGWHGESDITAAIDFLMARPEVDPKRIAVLGLSMGGEEAIGAAGSDSRIAAVIAEGASARSEADKSWYADQFGWRGSIQLALEWLQYAIADLLTHADKPVPLRTAAADMAPRPLLLITAGSVPDELRAARHIQGSGRHIEIWDVSGASHVGALAVAREQWERTVIGFLDTGLAAS